MYHTKFLCISRKTDSVTGKKLGRKRPGAVALMSRNAHYKRHEVSRLVETLNTIFNDRVGVCVGLFSLQ